MIDIQNNKDDRGIKLNSVGIKDFILQLKINDQQSIARIQFGVSLCDYRKGIHMSRLCQLLDSFDTLDNNNLERILTAANKLLESETSNIVIDTLYFKRKKSPITDNWSNMNYQVNIHANVSQGKKSFVHSISIPITAVCPCSKAISDFGAHNQRGIVCVTILDVDICDYDKIIEVIEKQACSCDLYSVLKREDEKQVTEFAYNNPKFVEDIVRESILCLRNVFGERVLSVECTNYESIHNHNAFANYSNIL